MKNKTFDLKDIFNIKRPLSWSAISSFEWNRDQWWRKYVGKELPEITPELEFGSRIDKLFQDDPTFLPELIRYPTLQHEMRCNFNGIPLVGFSDQFDESVPALRDLKTGRRKWDKKRADETGQLTMYCFMLWQMKKIRPEHMQLYIDWLPTHIENGKIAFIKEGDVKTFKTKRTMQQVLEFGQKIQDIYKEMEEYCKHRPMLDTHSYDDFFNS